ncbi:MAG: citrate synthase [Lentisphaerae bacterium]|nr:citrate synthase [Lentisphaerota bacterium]
MASEIKNRECAVLKFEGKEVELPVVTGTEGDKALDIRALRSETGLVTIDPGFVNTASCRSQITYIDGERGILRYRGIPIEELVKKSTFVDVAYLLVHGTLPTAQERLDFSSMLNLNSLIHEDMRRFFDHFPQGAHPMHILSTMINAMAAFYPNVDINTTTANIEQSCARVISIVRTIAAFAYKKSIGEPIVYPRHDLSYCANFLNMMFDSPVRPYHISPETVRLLNVLFILHADHEQNCSTSAVRVIGSAQVNLYATISAGISALSGPLHGGANQAVIEQLKIIHKDGDVNKFINMAKDKNSPFRLMGFGHRVYKSYDPRAAIIRKECENYLNRIGSSDPLLETARKLEDAALKDPYFIERSLYPNVDFYTGILYRAMGIPENMFTVMFALARLPGWVAHWREMIGDSTKIVRPRQLYIGRTLQEIGDELESRSSTFLL